MSRLISLVMAAGAMTLALPLTAQADDDMPGVIHVTASATADAVPDRATVSAGVQSEAATAQEAMRKNSVLMRNVFTTLAAEGIPERDISTSSLNLSPRYNYEIRENGQPRLIGYQVSNQVMVTTRDLDAVGPMIDAVIKAGVNDINNVQFSVTDSEAAQTKARADAIAKARTKAAQMADAAGVELGDLVSMSEGQTAAPPRPFFSQVANRQAEAMDVAPPLAPGQREISATVSLTYAIDD